MTALRATYRLQLRPSFGFAEATAIVPYLARLGVSHVYASPVFASRPGSSHGYDTVDFTRIDDELGGETGFRALVRAVRAHGLGLLLDFVPNHMGAHEDNLWWWDVLAWGRESPRAAAFDIDWSPPGAPWKGKLPLPFLGAPNAEVLERCELKIELDGGRGAFVCRHFDHRWPIRPADWRDLLGDAAPSPFRPALDRLATADLPLRLRRLEAEGLGVALREAAASGSWMAEIATGLTRVQGTPGDRASFDGLHALLERQVWRAAWWRVSSEQINFRRFFEIDELPAIRQEHERTFVDSHAALIRLIRDGLVDGLRLDHVDWLADPAAYLRRLRLATGRRPDLPVYVEKILGAGERLRPDWPVQGTTGYEIMGLIGQVLIDPAGAPALTRAYERFPGRARPWAEVEREARREIIAHSFASEVARLSRWLLALAQQDRHTRDLTLGALTRAVGELLAHFPAYRTYGAGGAPAPEDRAVLAAALASATASGVADAGALAFLAATLGAPPDADRVATEVRRRFEQLSGPVAAKSVEDTGFYRHAHFLAVNEVGGHPERLGVDPAGFHAANEERARTHPPHLLATATHDHKRGEDVRARLFVLSELAETWEAQVFEFLEATQGFIGTARGLPAPTLNDRYLFFQTLVGCWPPSLAPDDLEGLAALRERLEAYALKAAREAKRRTSWTDADAAYEGALTRFIGEVLRPGTELLGHISWFQRRLGPAGPLNGLVQAALRLTIPGVPDTYQGCETWDLSLVDPDNRRPVAYDALAGALDAALAASPDDLLRDWGDGSVKQRVVGRLLAQRRAVPAPFLGGTYEPLALTGAEADRALAFLQRGAEGTVLVVIVPRLVAGLVAEDRPHVPPARWGDTAVTLPPDLTGALRPVLTDGPAQSVSGGVALAAALAPFPLFVGVVGAA